MFVNIDMDNLVFLHKHHDQEVINGLAFLEACDRSVRTENTTGEFWFRGLTTLEMQMLYRNTTGFDMAYKWDEIQRALMNKLVDRLPDTLALPHEVAAQIAAVEDDLYAGKAYKYVLGATTPAAPLELFPVLKAKPLEDGRQKQIAATVPPPPPPGSAPVAPPPPPAPPATMGVVSKRPASVRPAMYAVVNRIWEREGKPLDKDKLDAIKAEAAEELKAQGFNPTTVRIKMTEWGRERAAE